MQRVWPSVAVGGSAGAMLSLFRVGFLTLEVLGMPGRL